MRAFAASARRWLAGRSAERQGGPPSPKLRRAAFASIVREGGKEARRSRAAERDATRLRSSSFGEASPEPWRRRGGGAPRASKNAIHLWIQRVVATAVAVVIGGGSSVLACPMCFGAEETSMIDGTKLGIVVMLAITFAVQGAFAAFFLHLRKRAKRIAEIDLDSEWSELQKPSRTP